MHDYTCFNTSDGNKITKERKWKLKENVKAAEKRDFLKYWLNLVSTLGGMILLKFTPFSGLRTFYLKEENVVGEICEKCKGKKEIS